MVKDKDNKNNNNINSSNSLVFGGWPQTKIVVFTKRESMCRTAG